jgi:hypothetical protein
VTEYDEISGRLLENVSFMAEIYLTALSVLEFKFQRLFERHKILARK